MFLGPGDESAASSGYLYRKVWSQGHTVKLSDDKRIKRII